MAEQLEILAHSVTAVLATWLGLTVLTRASDTPAARVFGLLCALIATWSLAIVAARLTVDPTVATSLLRIENAAAFIIPAVVFHVALRFAVEGPWTAMQRVARAGAYAMAIAMALLAVFAPEATWDLSPPHFSALGIPGAVFGWMWIAARLSMLAGSVFLIASRLPQAGDDLARRQQLLAALATIVVGAVGGALRIVSEAYATEPWVGVSLVAIGVVIAAYAVFAQGAFLAPSVAGRAFFYSMVVGLGMALFVGVVVAVDALVRRTLDIEVPIVAIVAIVATVALFDPLADLVRRWVGQNDQEATEERLLRALNEDVLTAQSPHRAVEPALARVVRSVRLRGAAVLDVEGDTVAEVGSVDRSASGVLRLPLVTEEEVVGVVLFGTKRSHLPFTAQEMGLLQRAADFLGTVRGLAADHGEQATALAELSDRSATAATLAADLSRALGEATMQSREGLLVYALGPLRVERNGAVITRWGGEKAGSRQAEAIFAFLLDRGERGVAKDEILELVWPDVDLDRADLAFHRTLGGLRSTLEPGRRARDRGDAITFHHDRYLLNPAIVTGSDVSDLEAELAVARAATDRLERLAHLERARTLFRGEYLDDCPFYGDSEFVEERRSLLRGQRVDLLVALGELYEEAGDRATAASCFRQARVAAGEPVALADAALQRLGSTV